MMATPLPRTVEVIESGIGLGIHPGAQLYVSLGGRTVLDIAFGNARDGVAMTVDSLPGWLSAGKPLTAVAVAQIVERGLLSFDDAVARYIAEFAQHGKGDVTVRHLLTHTSPLRKVVAITSPGEWDAIIERICDATPEANWPSGKRAGYHAGSGWFLLAELVRRLDGRRFERYVQEAIFRPIGMDDCFVGMTVGEYQRVRGRLALLYATHQQPIVAEGFLNSEEGCLVCRPGANARGPVHFLGRFYEMLLAGGMIGGNRILGVDMVGQITRRQRVGMFDETFEHIIDWGLGFIIDSKRYGEATLPYGYGRYASDETFGHSGRETSCGFGDPKHQLAVAWVCNGQPGEEVHQQRNEAINSAIYEDLGLGSV
jgi:CubicO group peptidase (beta-lactamase class C family)